MFRLTNFALFLATATAFAPVAFHKPSSTLPARPATTTTLGVSVVSEFLYSDIKKRDDKRIRDTFETETPLSVGVKGPGIQQVEEEQEVQEAAQQEQQQQLKKKKRSRKPKRKHNYKELEEFLKEVPDLDFYTLHSSAVSRLYIDMPIDDIFRAIKRAQNRHDAHDLKTIAAFLIEECDEHWGYGFRGSLLSRLSVAALHLNEIDVAMKAIETRRVHERPSMQPFESVGIVRGLMRAGLKEEGWAVLEDELRLPLTGTDLRSPENQEILKQRAHALSSIATRHFYNVEPHETERALSKLKELGSFVAESKIDFEDLKMPWARLEAAAAECNVKLEEAAAASGQPQQNVRDMRELVWEAIAEFPCPGHEEECSLESFFLTP